MRIEAYFQQLQQTIEACTAVQAFNLTYNKRSTHTGFIRGETYFFDGSTLHLREFVDVEFAVDRLMYAYHYVDHTDKLIFRYDNTGHHKGQPFLPIPITNMTAAAEKYLPPQHRISTPFCKKSKHC